MLKRKRIVSVAVALALTLIAVISASASTQWVAHRTGTTQWWSPNELYYGGEYSGWTTVKAHASFRWDANRINSMISHAENYGYFSDIHYDDESSPWPAYPSASTYFSNLPGYFYFTDQAEHEANFVVTYPRGLTPGVWYETKAYYAVSHMVEGWINVSGYVLDNQTWSAWGREWLAKLIYRGYYSSPQFEGQPAIGKGGAGSEYDKLGLRPDSNTGSQQVMIGRGEGPGYWYTAIEKEGKILVVVIFEPETLEEIRQYVAENRQLATDLLTQGYASLPVVVTFQKPLSFTRAAELVNNSGLEVESYQLRGYINGGDAPQDRFTAGCAPRGGTLFPKDELEMLTEDLREVGGEEFAGVISIKGALSPKGYSWLSSQPEVFLVDVMKRVLADELSGKASGKPIEVLLESPYWFVENYTWSEAQ